MGRRGSISPAGAAAALLLPAIVTVGCGRAFPTTDWRCDFDASENRPLADPDGSEPDGAVPSVDCQNTCGTPVMSCERTTLEGGVAGAVCPVCTF